MQALNVEETRLSSAGESRFQISKATEELGEINETLHAKETFRCPKDKTRQSIDTSPVLYSSSLACSHSDSLIFHLALGFARQE